MARIPIFTSLLDTIRSCSVGNSSAKPLSLGVIISTYNNPCWLEKTLWGYQVQKYDRTPVELVIADDGSTEETRKLIDRYRSEFPWQIKHVWHPDEGFRKCEILNRAIWETEADYLVFADQDCIPYPNNLETHYRYAQRGWFLSGGNIRLPLNASRQIRRDDIESGLIFRSQWLWQHYPADRKWNPFKWFPLLFSSSIWNWLTTSSATWNGGTSSCWRDDALLVNGFNELMRYGGEDREFGERLMNSGIRARQCRYSLISLHLDHPRPYDASADWKQNDAIRRQVRNERCVETPHGIRQHLLDWVGGAQNSLQMLQSVLPMKPYEALNFNSEEQPISDFPLNLPFPENVRKESVA